MRQVRAPLRMWGALLPLACVAAAVHASTADKTTTSQEVKLGEILADEDMERVRTLLKKMCTAFKNRDHNAVKALFVAPDEVNQPRLDALGVNLKRELKKETYREIDVVEVTPEAQTAPGCYSVWVRLRYELQDEPGLPPRRATHNDFFTVARNADGSFALVDSPFFNTLGQRQGLNLIASALLWGIVLLALLTFWVWMGYAAFRMRPRSHAWRIAVVVLPLLGAVLFFLAAYLPGLFRRKTPPLA